MTRRRHLLAVAAAAVGALALVVPVVHAQVDPPLPTPPSHDDSRWLSLNNEGVAWRGFFDPVPEAITGLGGSIRGWLEYWPTADRAESDIATITLSLSVVGERAVPLPDACPRTFTAENVQTQQGDFDPDTDPPVGLGQTPTAPRVATFEFSLALVCNARYRVEVVGTATDPATDPAPDPAPEPILPSKPLVAEELFLEVAPPEVGQVIAAREEGIVALSWSPPLGYPEGAPADFVGYRVLRAMPDQADFNQAATPGNNTIAFDQLPEGTVGEVRYQVQAVRRSANGDGYVGSQIGATASASVVIDSPVTAPPAPQRRRNTTRQSSSRNTPAAPTVDDDFESTLDFEDFEPGLEEPVLPESAAGLELDDDDGPGEGLAIPAATASVLAAWALHLRYLSRRVGDTI